MPLYYQVTNLPLLYQIGPGLIGRIPEILEEKNLTFRRVLLLSGSSFSGRIADEVLASPGCRGWLRHAVSEGSTEEVDSIAKTLMTQPVELIVAVGGGKVIDVAKRVSFLRRVNNLVVPTVVSNDGLISPISVLRGADGRTESLPAQMPMGVIADTAVIGRAPVRFLRAAAGDVLSNLSAARDWEIAAARAGETMHDIPYRMARMSASSLIHMHDFALDSEEFLTQLINTQLNSGIAMALAGTSRPCSGSEHLLSHAIDFLGLSPDTLHGLQVGSTSLFTLYLQGDLPDYCQDYARTFDIPLVFDELSAAIGPAMPKIVELARQMRPGRYTVLDEFTDAEIVQAFQSFKRLRTPRP